MTVISSVSCRASSSRPPLFVQGDAFAPLLDHRLQHGENAVFVDSFQVALAAGGDIAVLKRRQDQPDGGEGPLLLGLHGGLQGVVQTGAEHGAPPGFSGNVDVTEKRPKRQLLDSI